MGRAIPRAVSQAERHVPLRIRSRERRLYHFLSFRGFPGFESASLYHRGVLSFQTGKRSIKCLKFSLSSPFSIIANSGVSLTIPLAPLAPVFVYLVAFLSRSRYNRARSWVPGTDCFLLSAGLTTSPCFEPFFFSPRFWGHWGRLVAIFFLVGDVATIFQSGLLRESEAF